MQVFEKRLAIEKCDPASRALFSQPDGADFSGVNEFYKTCAGQPGYLAAGFRARKPTEFRRKLRRVRNRLDLNFLRG